MTAPICFYLKDGIFAGGAVLTLAATALGLTSFILLRTQAANAACRQFMPRALCHSLLLTTTLWPV
jgi:hypothetical protein